MAKSDPSEPRARWGERIASVVDVFFLPGPRHIFLPGPHHIAWHSRLPIYGLIVLAMIVVALVSLVTIELQPRR